MLNLIRSFLSVLILFFDRVFAPKSVHRTLESQRAVDLAAAQLKLYQFNGCPFCVKVRRQIKRLGLQIELRDAMNNETFKQDLIEGGGKYQTPCLRIKQDDGTVQWLYESSDINKYLEQRFHPSQC